MRNHVVAWLLTTVAVSFAAPVPVSASRFTPPEWKRLVREHPDHAFIGQLKHDGWVRDADRNFIDDEITRRFGPDDDVDVVVELNQCMPPQVVRNAFGGFGRLRHVNRHVTFVIIDAVPFELLQTLARRSDVAMVEWKVPLRPALDVSTRAVQVRASSAYASEATDALGLTGAGVNIAVVDTGVDDGLSTFAGKVVLGFDATIFEDVDGDGVDDSCEVAGAPSTCSGADDEPGDGSTNPPDGSAVQHGTRVAAIALGVGASGEDCRTPSATSGLPCKGVAPGAGLVDVRVCTGGACDDAGIDQTDVSEALDWIVDEAETMGIRVVNVSLAECDLTEEDEGKSALSQLVNYVVASGITVVVAHGNGAVLACPAGSGSQHTFAPGSASLAITVAGSMDGATVGRDDDYAFSLYLTGPRTDWDAAAPNLFALKPDLAAPAQGILTPVPDPVGGGSADTGTSLAAPHLAGAVALILEARPPMDPGSIKDLLLTTADASRNTSACGEGTLAAVPTWSKCLGAGLLNAWEAASTAANTEVAFPSCVGDPGVLGRPCLLSDGLPAWKNTNDLQVGDLLQVDVETTVTADLENTGTADASALVTFGARIFGGGAPQFEDIGTQRVDVAAGTKVTVTQAWTPETAGHQCLQVSLACARDGLFWNNVTQRNLEVEASRYDVEVNNPLAVPASMRVQTRSHRNGWRCRVDDPTFTLNPILDCARMVRVVFDPPAGAQPGEQADCDVEIFATPLRPGAKAESVGGVTVRTYVPERCPISGRVVDASGNPVSRARVVLRWPGRGSTIAATTDASGAFTMRVPAGVPQRLRIRGGPHGRGEVDVRPACGARPLDLVLAGRGALQWR
jgi:subtilisin family serine protease